MTDFTGKTALITGAGSGIGRAAAQLYAARGGTVIAFDADDAVHDTAARPRPDHRADRRRRRQGRLDRAVAAAVAAGGLDFAFANAGVGGGLAPLFDLTVAEWESVLRVNLIGVFLTVQAAARVMVAAGAARSSPPRASPASARARAACRTARRRPASSTSSRPPPTSSRAPASGSTPSAPA